MSNPVALQPAPALTAASLGDPNVATFSASGQLPAGTRFDSYEDRLRNSITKITNTVTEAWEECNFMVQRMRILTYVLLFVTVLLCVGFLFNWNNAILLLMIIVQMVCLSYGTLLASQTACFQLLGN